VSGPEHSPRTGNSETGRQSEATLPARIGVVSDTHANLDLLERAREILVEAFEVGRVYHLGDNFSDAEAMMSWGVEVLRVPGLACQAYRSGGAPRVLRDEVAGRTHLLAHSEEDVPDAYLDGVDVLFVGHTHRFDVSRERGHMRVNPGHLRSHRDRGRPPTCALALATREMLEARILDVQTGEVVAREAWPRGDGSV
jgi:predicted phosphodiesterase